MPMCNMLECSGNYSMTSGNLWNCYKYEMNDFAIENDNGNMMDNNKTITSNYFK